MVVKPERDDSARIDSSVKTVSVKDLIQPLLDLRFQSFVSVSTGVSATFAFAYTVKLDTVNRTVQRPPGKDFSEKNTVGHARASDGMRIS
jgi:hypothetical protein